MKIKLLNLDRFSFNSILTIFIKGLGIVITYALMLFLTNFFSEELVGEFSISNNILLITGTICLFGANQSIYQIGGRFYNGKNKSGLKKIYTKYLIISGIIYVLLLATALLIPKTVYNEIFNEEGIYRLFLETISFAFVYFLASLNFEVLRIFNKIKSAEFFRSIFRTLIFFIGVLFIYYFNNELFLVEIFLLSFLVTAVITSVVVYKIFSKESQIQILRDEIFSFKKIIKVSFPMSIGAIFILLMQSVDSFFIIKYYSFEELAYYSIAVKLTVLISIILTSINTIIAPDISNFYFKKDFKKLKEIIFKSSKLNFLLTIPILACLLFFPNTILNFFGQNYINAKDSLIILSLGQIVSSFCGSVGLYLNMSEKQKYFLVLLSLSLIINVVLNFLLIPKYGIDGAAISSSISLVFWNITGLLFIYYKDKVITFFRF